MAANNNVAPSENTSLAGRRRFAPCLLRCHVVGSADHRAGRGQTGGRVADRRHAEVGEVRATLIVEQHVRRFDVAVDHAFAVGGGQRVEQRVGEQRDLPGCERARLPYVVRQRAAGEIRHHQHDFVTVVHEIDQADDVRMIEPGQGLGFAPDALTGAGHVAGAAVQNEVLEGNRMTVGVGGQVHDTHGAASQALLKPIAHRTGQPMGGADPFGPRLRARGPGLGARVCPQCVHRVTSGPLTSMWSIFVSVDR